MSEGYPYRSGSLNLNDTKKSVNVVIWVMHLIEAVSPPNAKSGDPRGGRVVDG